MTPEQAAALVALATDISDGDVDVVRQIQAAIRKPPRTTQEVGFYVSGKESDFELCFRHLVTLLDGYTSSAEDNYVYEIFPQWFGPDRLLESPPAELVAAFPEFLAESAEEADAAPDSGQLVERLAARLVQRYAPAVFAVERAFENVGRPLLTFELGGGDTLVFVNVTPPVAERWRDKVLGHTHRGHPLGLRAPLWDAFWAHVCYAFGLGDSEPPANVRRPPAPSA